MTKSQEQQPDSQRPYSAETYCALLDEAEKGLADVAAGRSSDARTSYWPYKRDAVRRQFGTHCVPNLPIFDITIKTG
jgi:hypothetical protein